MPVGVFLSGGIDSSTNAALFSEGETRAGQDVLDRLRGRLRHATRTSCTTRARWPSVVGAEHHERLLTQDDLLDFLPQMVRLQDEPIADPVCVPVYYVSKLARDNGVIVCQVGEGADELFCGYPTWKTQARSCSGTDDLPVPRVAQARRRSARATAAGRGESARDRVLRRGGDGQPVFWGGAEAFTAGAEAAAARRRGCGASSAG